MWYLFPLLEKSLKNGGENERVEEGTDIRITLLSYLLSEGFSFVFLLDFIKITLKSYLLSEGFCFVFWLDFVNITLQS